MWGGYSLSGKQEITEGDAVIIPPYAVHSVCQEREARQLSMCIGTAFATEMDSGTAKGIVKELLDDAVGQRIFLSANITL